MVPSGDNCISGRTWLQLQRLRGSAAERGTSNFNQCTADDKMMMIMMMNDDDGWWKSLVSLGELDRNCKDFGVSHHKIQFLWMFATDDCNASDIADEEPQPLIKFNFQFTRHDDLHCYGSNFTFRFLSTKVLSFSIQTSNVTFLSSQIVCYRLSNVCW